KCVIVICELNPGFLTGFARAIEKIGRALPSIWFLPLLYVDPRAHDVLLPDHVRGFEGLGPLLLERLIRNMFGWRSQTVLLECRTGFLRRLAKVACELHFAIADLGNFGECAVEILLHEFAYGIELQSDGVDAVCSVGRPRGTRSDDSRGERSFNKSSSIHGA